MSIGRVAVARRAMRSRSLRRVLAAFLVFNTAEWAIWVAVLVRAYDRGGVRASAAIGVVQLVPAIVVAPFGSVLGDRWPRSRALTAGYLVQAVTMLATAAALASGAGFLVVAPAAVAATCAVSLTRPVHYSLVPMLAHDPGELVAANSASTTAEGLGTILGPALCAGILAVSGPAPVLLLFGLASAAGAALVATVPSPHAGARSHRLLAETTAGVRELARSAPATLLTGMVTAEFVVVGALEVLVVALTLTILDTGSGGPGLLMALLGVGGLLGAVATVVLVGRRRLVPALAVGVLVSGVPLALVSVAPGIVVIAVLLTAYGAGKAFFDVAGRTLLQRTVPDMVLTRVFGVQEAMLVAGNALGNAVAPLAVLAFGIRGAFLAAGLFLPFVGVLAWRWLRGLDALSVLPGAGLELLRGVPTFRGLGIPQLESLSRELVELAVPPGESVVRQGQAGDRFYVVAEGAAQVTVDGHAVRTLGVGDGFGEIALLRAVPRTATVTATTPMRVLALGRDAFLAAIAGTSSARVAAEDVAAHHLAEDADRFPTPG